MKMECIQKLSRPGGSYSLIIPKKWIVENGIDVTGEVYLKVDERYIAITPPYKPQAHVQPATKL